MISSSDAIARIALAEEILQMKGTLSSVSRIDGLSFSHQIDIMNLHELGPVLEKLGLSKEWAVWVYAASHQLMPVVWAQGKFWFHLSEDSAKMLSELKFEIEDVLKRHTDIFNKRGIVTGPWHSFSSRRGSRYVIPHRVSRRMMKSVESEYPFAMALAELGWYYSIELMLAVTGQLKMALVAEEGRELFLLGLSTVQKYSSEIITKPGRGPHNPLPAVMFRLNTKTSE